MKHLMFISLCLLPLFASADDAAEFYKNGEYEEAATEYQKLIDKGHKSSDLYYNAGNAYFKSGNIGKAVLYLEKAHKLDPGDPDIRYNLDSIVRPATLDKIEVPKERGIQKASSELVYGRNRNFWSVLTLILWIVAFGSLAAYLLVKSGIWKQICFYSGFALIFLALISLYLAYSHKSHLETEDRAVVTTQSTMIRLAPSDNAEVSFELHAGTVVEILKKNKDWYQIKAGKYQGWVSRKGVETI